MRSADITFSIVRVALIGGTLCIGSPSWAQLGQPSAEDLSLRQQRLPFSVPATTPSTPDPQQLSGRWKTRLRLPGPPPAGVPSTGASTASAPALNGPPAGPPPPGGAGAAPMQRRLLCVPGFGPWSSTEGAPTQIVQTPKLVLLLFEEFHNVRKIHLNSAHPGHLTPTYAGDSVGHWEGDTLVVDTAGIKGPVVPNGADAAPTLHMTERVRKTEGGKVLEVRMSYYDTAGGTVPAEQTVTADWVGGPKLMEWVCEDGTDVSHPHPE
jgi:hypothetical protein